VIFAPRHFGSIRAEIAVVLLEVVFLIYMARMLGVDWVVVHLERVFAAIDRRKDKD